MKIELYNPYFYVTKVIKDSPAEKAGITSKSFYSTINGTNLTEVITYRSSHSEEEYKNNYSTFYEYDQEISMTSPLGEQYSFYLKKLSIKQQLQTLSTFSWLKYFLAGLMILTGICIILFLNTEKTTSSLVYSLYFIGILTANLFESEFSSPFFSVLCSVLLDLGIFFTFTCIFEYFSQIFYYANYRNPFKIIRFIPVTIIIIKYLHILCFNWNLTNNPFYDITSYVVVISCFIFIGVFIYVTLFFPKSLTTTFKFFIIGLAFAVIPLLIDHLSFLASNSLFMTESEKIYNIVAFIFIPFMLILAILHNKNLIRARIVSWLTSYIAFGIFSAPIFITFINYIKELKLDEFSLIYVLISPFIFQIINRIIIKFFSLNTNENTKKLNEFRTLITPITDTLLLHKVTTQEIVKILDCSFVFYYKKNPDGIWENLYTWGNITDKERETKINESYTKKRVTFYKDGCFSIPIIRDNKTSGVIYVGPKANGDQYLPGEHIIIEKMIRVFHSHYLMYTNNFLIKELRIKNDKLTRMQEGTILSMANLIESRDGGTGAHVKRTAEYSVLISKRAQEKELFKDEIDEAYIDLIFKAAPMHDIGKIVVPDDVLKKPGKLSPKEFELMKLHTTEGRRIVEEVLSATEDEDYIKMTSDIAMYHHEKWDGSGYPAGLKETEIPLCARILAIADVFDALVSPRCYK